MRCLCIPLPSQGLLEGVYIEILAQLFPLFIASYCLKFDEFLTTQRNSMFCTFSFNIEGTSKKGVAVFYATGTNLQQKKIISINKNIYY
jgi:hypothetical protein